MSLWTIGLFVYLALSVIASVLVMSMLILGKRSDQRCLRPHDEGEPQRLLQPAFSGDWRIAA